MAFTPLDTEDQQLIAAATDVMQKNYHPVKRTVAAAVRCGSGRVYTGANLEACGYDPCTEPIAISSALTNDEREIASLVAVCKRYDEYRVQSPCGDSP